jgi:hypothetical protein
LLPSLPSVQSFFAYFCVTGFCSTFPLIPFVARKIRAGTS